MKPQLVGIRNLNAITFGLTQVKVQGDSLIYTETINFGKERKYSFSRDGKPYESGLAHTDNDKSHASYEMAVSLGKDMTLQPFELMEGRLFLYQHGAQGSFTANGNTFEHKRQQLQFGWKIRPL
ncbi:hypothetical protein [Persicitalea jodogahamensis]|uniref:Uncharacterized protein n=1 Tax=Persicitalea jodogahamensis TaxID=402147 RepID=A0A8J3DA90_9BACT|nr:hypothetical protein [Persicitalea jodogahamensis]GHB75537.1 hypothetical protein GCM10007390_31610 [Persicitalea jodogahamensis]